MSLPQIEAQVEQEGLWEGELVQTCCDGRVVTVESRWSPVRDASGRVRALLEVNRDITRRWQLEQQARLFGRFVRAENARTTEIAGTGLGLYLSRELVEQHGGQLWFESAEGVGSTFSLSLPVP